MAQSLTDCEDVFNLYKSIMNNFETKNEIVRGLIRGINGINNSFYFMGSYMAFPKGDPKNLKVHYGKDVDADLFETIVDNIRIDFRKVPVPARYICFLVGGIVKDDDVSHHLGFIYDRTSNKIKVLDPGQQSWGPELANTATSVVKEAFPAPEYINAYSKQWCTLCGRKKGCPQDTTRPLPYIEEAKNFFSISSDITIHRETFCQTWSILLILTEIEKIITDPNHVFSEPRLTYWDLEKRNLEMCIRRFILWIVFKKPEYFEWQYTKGVNYNTNNLTYLPKLLACFKLLIPDIETPIQDEAICDGNYSTPIRGRAASAAVPAISTPRRRVAVPPTPTAAAQLPPLGSQVGASSPERGACTIQ